MLDYVTQNLMDEGSPLGFTYIDKDLVSIFSPIGLVEGCANETNGKLLYDFILSKEGQEILVENNLLSVRMMLTRRAQAWRRLPSSHDR